MCSINELNKIIDQIGYEPRPSTFWAFPGGKDRDRLGLTFTCRPSAVVSSNSSPSLKEISKFLKEVSVLMFTLSPGALMRIQGFSEAASGRMVTGTPAGRTQQPRLGRSANRLLGSNVKRVWAAETGLAQWIERRPVD